MTKVPKIASLQNLCNISRKKLVFDLDKHQSFLQFDTIIFHGRDQACLNC